MNVVSLDQIVKNILLKRRYTMHWYLDFLVPAKDGLRELSFDYAIETLRYKILPVDQTSGNVTIPDDFSDWARVSLRSDQYLIPLVEDNSLDTIPNYDSDFVVQPYITGVATQPNTQYYNGYLSPYWWLVNWNSFGENLGRQFGGIGTYSDTFKIDRKQNIIKINETLGCTEVVLEYIGNGTDADSATHIHAYAQAPIESYAIWQFKENNRTYNAGDVEMAKRNHEQQVQILAARLSDLTMEKFKRIVQKNAIGIKY